MSHCHFCLFRGQGCETRMTVYDSPHGMDKAGSGAENKTLLGEICGGLSGSSVPSFLSANPILSLTVNMSISQEGAEIKSDAVDQEFLEGFVYFHNGNYRKSSIRTAAVLF